MRSVGSLIRPSNVTDMQQRLDVWNSHHGSDWSLSEVTTLLPSSCDSLGLGAGRRLNLHEVLFVTLCLP